MIYKSESVREAEQQFWQRQLEDENASIKQRSKYLLIIYLLIAAIFCVFGWNAIAAFRRKIEDKNAHTGYIHLLPALPDEWHTGSVKGLRCRGGFEIIELCWADGNVTQCKIRSDQGGILRVKINGDNKFTLREKETLPGDIITIGD